MAKKVTSKETFEFLVRGIKGTPNEVSVEVGPKGVVVDDETARMLEERFGSNIEISNATEKTAPSKKEDEGDEKDSESDEKKDDKKVKSEKKTKTATKTAK